MQQRKSVVSQSDPKGEGSAQPSKSGNILNFQDIRRAEWQADPLANMLGKTLTVNGVEFQQARRGTVTILLTSEGRYYTFSSVIQRQAEMIKPYTDQGKSIRTTVRKTKNYYVLE